MLQVSTVPKQRLIEAVCSMLRRLSRTVCRSNELRKVHHRNWYVGRYSFIKPSHVPLLETEGGVVDIKSAISVYTSYHDDMGESVPASRSPDRPSVTKQIVYECPVVRHIYTGQSLQPNRLSQSNKFSRVDSRIGRILIRQRINTSEPFVSIKHTSGGVPAGHRFFLPNQGHSVEAHTLTLPRNKSTTQFACFADVMEIIAQPATRH
jgi:hypothetical protein